MSVKEWKRSDWDGLRFIEGSPQVHIHYLSTDAEADAQGFGRAELCCHGCGSAVIVTYTWPQEDNALKPLRDEFVEAHRACLNIGGEMLCPLDRSSVVHRDLRVEPPLIARGAQGRDEMSTGHVVICGAVGGFVLATIMAHFLSSLLALSVCAVLLVITVGVLWVKDYA